MNTETIKAIIYAVAEFVVVLNGFLVAMGKSPLPIDEFTVLTAGSYVASVVAFFMAIWKNHNFTTSAQTAQKLLNKLKLEIKQGGTTDGN